MDSNATPPPRLRAFRTVRGRMLFWIVAVTMPIYAGALYMSYEVTARRLEAGSVRGVDEVTARLGARLGAAICPLERGVPHVCHSCGGVSAPPRAHHPRV